MTENPWYDKEAADAIDALKQEVLKQFIKTWPAIFALWLSLFVWAVVR